MRDLEPQEVIDYLHSSLDALRDFISSVERDRDGLPIALSFEGPGGWSDEIPLCLTGRSLGIGDEVVNLSAPNAGATIVTVLALELAKFVGSERPPLLRPRTQR